MKRKLTYDQRAYLAAEDDLEKEKVKQVDIFYADSAIVWFRSGWKNSKIMEMFKAAMKVWDECGSYGTKKSMPQIFEEETGIELTLSGYDKSWHDCAFLNDDKWNGKIPSIKYMTELRRKQKPWLAICIFACNCLALRRKLNVSDDKMVQYIKDIDQLRQQLGEDAAAHKRMCKELTGIDIDELWKNREAWDE